MAARPWMKFYPADWQADQALRSVGLEARCLWLECMCIMHRADPYGHLVVHGHPVTDTQLAILAGSSSDRVPALMAELATAGVFSRNRAGVIYSRRMTRDEKRSKDGATGKITGQKLPRSRRSQAIDNATDKSSTLEVVGKVVEQPPSPQRPEARPTRKDSEEADASSAPAPLDAASVLIGRCTTWLAKSTGRPEKSVRALVVGMLKRYGDGAVLEVFTEASRAPPAEAISWIESRLKRRAEGGGRINGASAGHQRAVDILRDAALDYDNWEDDRGPPETSH